MFVLFTSLLLIYVVMIWKSGKLFPILYLFLFAYSIQYLFSTYLIYNVYDGLGKQMKIGADRYFDYAIPATLSLFAGVFIFNKDIDLRSALSKINPVVATRMGFLLLTFSYGMDILEAVGLSFLGSIISLTSFLKYPATFCFLFSNYRFRYILIGLVYMHLGVVVLQGGVFINLFAWATYLFFFIVLRFNIRFWMRMSFIAIAAPVLIIVQSVKNEYREQTWERQGDAGIVLFSELAAKNAPSGNLLNSHGVISTVGRLTQGWHLGLTLRHVPERQPFVNGDEFLGDIQGTLLPRVFFSEKKMVGGQDKFYKYTGHKLVGNTSMTIGVLGDFYVNFGREGSYFALFVFGALIARSLYYFIIRYVGANPINIIWVPYLTSYLIRANNDFYMVFNNMVKGFLLFLLIGYLYRLIWGFRYEPYRTTKALN